MTAVRVAASLRRHVGGAHVVEVEAQTVGEAVSRSGLGEVALSSGAVADGVSVFLNDDDVRYLDGGLDEAVAPTDEVTVMVAVAGG